MVQINIDIPNEVIEYGLNTISNAIAYWAKIVEQTDDSIKILDLEDNIEYSFTKEQFINSLSKMVVNHTGLFNRLINGGDKISVDVWVQLTCFNRIVYC